MNSLSGFVFTHSNQWLCSAQTLEKQLTCWMRVHHSSQYLYSTQTLESNSQPSRHPFISVVLVCSNTGTGERLTSWMLTVLLSGSDLVKQWRVTHFLDTCSPILKVTLICLNTGEQLTCWMCIRSHQWF